MRPTEWVSEVLELLEDVHALLLEVEAGMEDGTNVARRLHEIDNAGQRLMQLAGDIIACTSCGRPVNDCSCSGRAQPVQDDSIPF